MVGEFWWGFRFLRLEWECRDLPLEGLFWARSRGRDGLCEAVELGAWSFDGAMFPAQYMHAVCRQKGYQMHALVRSSYHRRRNEAGIGHAGKVSAVFQGLCRVSQGPAR